MEHYAEYGKAPQKDIQGILNYKRKKELQDDQVVWIEEIISSLDDEYLHKEFNVEYLVDQTKKYLQERSLHALADEIKGKLDEGNPIEAEEAAASYISATSQDNDRTSTIDPFTREARTTIQAAFEEREKPLFEFGGKIGEFWNYEFTRDGFVALMGHEKIGKTFLLMEIAMQAAQANINVGVFQAGDMTKNQQIRRMGIHCTKRSDQKRYCGELLIPVVDCISNQLGTCSKSQRESLVDIDIENREQLKKLTYHYLAHSTKTG